MVFNEEEKKDLMKAIRETILSLEDEPFWIPREKHYRQHLFLGKLEEWIGNLSSTFWKSLIRGIVKVIIYIILIGFGVWGVDKTGLLK